MLLFVADGLIVTFDDITERKRAGREHDRMAAALEQSPDSIFIVDTDFRIVHANPTYVASVGRRRPRWSVGARPTSRTASSTQPCMADGEPVLLWSGRPWSGEVDHRNPDGTLSRMEASITPLREATGEISGWLGVARDVTDRNQSRTTSRSQRRGWRTAMDSMLGGVVVASAIRARPAALPTSGSTMPTR